MGMWWELGGGGAVFCVLGAVILALYKEKKVMGIIEEAHKKENLPE